MANAGKKVSVHYVGTLDDGTKFDSSRDRGATLDFTCMAGQMIPGFDKAVDAMEVGQIVNVRLEPSEAYGEKNPDMTHKFLFSEAPDAAQFNVGDAVMLQTPMGPRQAVISEKDDEGVTVDMNHPMAGKALNFEIELISVEE